MQSKVKHRTIKIKSQQNHCTIRVSGFLGDDGRVNITYCICTMSNIPLTEKNQTTQTTPVQMQPATKMHNLNSEIEFSITQERLRQARCSFNLALIATALSACISVVGGGLMLSGKVSEGTVTAAGGMAASVRCIQLAKDANDRLDKILPELKDED